MDWHKEEFERIDIEHFYMFSFKIRAMVFSIMRTQQLDLPTVLNKLKDTYVRD